MAALEWVSTHLYPTIGYFGSPDGLVLLCSVGAGELGLWSLSVAAAHIWFCMNGRKEESELISQIKLAYLRYKLSFFRVWQRYL